MGDSVAMPATEGSTEPRVAVSFSESPQSSQCYVNASLSGFLPNNDYVVTFYRSGAGAPGTLIAFVDVPVTTDDVGNLPNVGESIAIPSGTQFAAGVGDVLSPVSSC